MIVTNPTGKDVLELKKMWKRIFADTDEYIGLFFSRKFRTENTYIIKDREILSMAYVVPYVVDNLKAAYICGVATKEKYRGLGLSTKIMEHIKEDLIKRNFDMSFLIPAGEPLFEFYRALGFADFTYLSIDKIKRTKEISNEPYTCDFSYLKLNELYNAYFLCPKVKRDEKEFLDIFHCYKNVRIYKDGYMIYGIEDGELYIFEHTFKNPQRYFNDLMNDQKVQYAYAAIMQGENANHFSMACYYKTTALKNAYVNLLLN